LHGGPRLLASPQLLPLRLLALGAFLRNRLRAASVSKGRRGAAAQIDIVVGAAAVRRLFFVVRALVPIFLLLRLLRSLLRLPRNGE
jgi:hypothetical protein